MSLSVHTNAVQMTALRALGMVSGYGDSVRGRLASGRNVSTAYDDGATYATSLRIDGQVKAINAINERLNNTKEMLYRSTNAVSHMSMLTAEVRKSLVKLADTSLVGPERENYEIQYKRSAREILDNYNALLKDGTSLVSDGDFHNRIYTSPHRVVSSLDGRSIQVGDADPTGSSMNLSGFSDPNNTVNARNKEDLAQWWRQVFLDTGQDLVHDSGGFPSDQQPMPIPDAERATEMINDSGSSPYRLVQFEDALSRVMNGLFKDLRSVQNHIGFNSDIASANEAGLSAMLDADMTKENARLRAIEVRQQMAREGLAIMQNSKQVILGLLV